ncbi:MAG: hypothetical protein AB3N06_01780 [Erythrobacter sp.]
MTLSVLFSGLFAALAVTKLGGGVTFATTASFATSAIISVALRGSFRRWFDEVVRSDQDNAVAYRQHMTRLPKQITLLLVLVVGFAIGGIVMTSPFLLAAAGALLGTLTFVLLVKSAVNSGASYNERTS